jgi:phosphopantothenoylcysteine decarboxylase / phosphopantothenate---cysteine ligase
VPDPDPTTDPDSAEPALLGVRVLLGVTGGIAAYKAPEIARLLVKAGAEVETILTRGGSFLVGPATFAGVTGKDVRTEVWEDVETVPHVTLARAADAIIVAPATAQLLAKAAAGIADDLLTNVLLMVRCPVLFAPAMHTEMWEHPATQANVDLLRQRGVHLVGPEAGDLAAGDVGIGRMSEPPEIHAALVEILGRQRDLAGRTVVVTAGGTREHLDPVRFLGNRSSGRMGYAVAAAAARRGASVHLVSAPTLLRTPPGVQRHDVVSTREMREAVLGLLDRADVVVKAAAVSDFRPTQSSEQKLKKAAGPPTVELERNPDILAELGEEPGGDRPVLVGFAAETERAEEQGREKLRRKGADLMVVNDVSRSGAGFEVETNQVLILGRDGRRVEVPLSSKDEVAGKIWDEVVTLLR